MSEEWGPWIEHDGKGCPCVGMFVEVVEVHVFDLTVCDPRKIIARGGNGWRAKPGQLVPHSSRPSCFARPIIRYRIRKPRALLEMIERARKLDDAPECPARVKPKVGA